MDRWKGLVALVTGASSGIGAAICESLVKSGMKVVGAARGVERIEQLSEKLKGEEGSLLPVKCDVSNDEEIRELFDVIKKKYGGVDVCINNAGMSSMYSLLDGTPEAWRYQMDVNVIALCSCTKLSIASMRERNVDDGQIINVSSLFGHLVYTEPSSHFYAATKHAVSAITQGLRQELRALNSHIRAACISPGFVETEIITRALNEEESKKFFSTFTAMQAEDISATIVHMLSAPPHVEINDIVIRPTEQPF